MADEKPGRFSGWKEGMPNLNGTIWLIVGVLAIIALIVFIIQNTQVT